MGMRGAGASGAGLSGPRSSGGPGHDDACRHDAAGSGGGTAHSVMGMARAGGIVAGAADRSDVVAHWWEPQNAGSWRPACVTLGFRRWFARRGEDVASTLRNPCV